MTSETATLGLLRRLIAIDSVNPGLVPGAAGEAAAARFAAEWLASQSGFAVRMLEHGAGRASVLGVARGTGGGRSLMLNGHLDTVALSSYDGDGLGPAERDGNLYGRGAYDMKSGIAAIMVAAAAAASAPHRGDIVVALVADEEWASAGTEAVLREVVTDAAIVAEPSNLDLVIAHRGFALAEITVHGVAAHGSRPDLGVDAIAKSGRFLTALDDLAQRLAAGRPDPLVGTGGVHAATITGGIEYSTYPDRCSISVERRTVPGEDASTTDAELRAILTQIAAADPAFRFDLAVTAERPPFAADPDSAVAHAVTTAFREVTGAEPRRRGEAFWTDCALLGAAGIDTVMFGVDGAWRARRDGMGHAFLAAHRHPDPHRRDHVVHRLTRPRGPVGTAPLEARAPVTHPGQQAARAARAASAARPPGGREHGDEGLIMNVRITVCRAAGLAAVVTAISGLGLSAGASAATTPSAAAAVKVQPATAVPPPTGGTVTCAIQSNNGDFLSAVGGGGRTADPVIRTDATQIRSWETFTLVPAGDGIHYGIRTINGNFLTAVGGGGRITDVIHSDATWLRAWEEFRFVPLTPTGPYGIETVNGHFLTSVGDGGRSFDAIHSDATRIQSWEMFWPICGI